MLGPLHRLQRRNTFRTLLMKKTLVATLFLLTSCGSIQMEPIDLGLEVEALGGMFKVKPQIFVGDGKLGPSAIEIEVKKTEEKDDGD